MFARMDNLVRIMTRCSTANGFTKVYNLRDQLVITTDGKYCVSKQCTMAAMKISRKRARSTKLGDYSSLLTDGIILEKVIIFVGKILTLINVRIN